MGKKSAQAIRLQNLRTCLEKTNLDGFILPREDEFQQENLPPASERLYWLTGFSGSAGFAILLMKKAFLLTDGRYLIQSRKEVDTSLYEIIDSTQKSPETLLVELAENDNKAGAGLKIGYDSSQFCINRFKRMKEAVENTRLKLIAMPENPVDSLWQDKPSRPTSPIMPHPMTLSGEDSVEKRRKIARKIEKYGADALLLNDLASIAWLLNIRGDDIPFMPVARCLFILHKTGEGELFIDRQKLSTTVEEFLGSEIHLHDGEDGIADYLNRSSLETIWLAPALATVRLEAYIRHAGKKCLFRPDPCLEPKACRNDIEIKNLRLAHRQDGVAVVRFFSWLESCFKNGKEKISEEEAAEKMLDFRRFWPTFRGSSFPAISAFAGNGAIIHYRPGSLSADPVFLKPDGLYLLDSGGQYLEATTDVTRTVAIGSASASEKKIYNLVLKGHIALARAIFPEKTTGSQLDSMARIPLWQQGADYSHGTGHGVGNYLSVHEGPQFIAKRPGGPALKKGMVVSNEPGYYREDAFGIRLENLLLVCDAPDHQSFLRFETLTLAPFDKNLIEKKWLGPEECDWLNNYHEYVREELAPLLAEIDAEALAWLENQVRPV